MRTFNNFTRYILTIAILHVFFQNGQSQLYLEADEMHESKIKNPDVQVTIGMVPLLDCPDPDSLVLERTIAGFTMGNDYSDRIRSNRLDTTEEFFESFTIPNIDRSEFLVLIPHPGGSRHGINEACIVRSDTELHYTNYLTKMPVDHFRSDLGVELGMDSNQIIEIFGHEYNDSTKYFLPCDQLDCQMMYYVLYSPCDTRDSILKNANMPVYYMEFQLLNARLTKYCFGYMYP